MIQQLPRHRLAPVSFGALAACVLACSGCSSASSAPVGEPGVFLAGSAALRLPVPLGISTAGFSGMATPGPRGRYSELFPATQRLAGHPGLKAVALSRGSEFEVIIVSADELAIAPGLRDSVLDELARRTGRDFDHALVLSATHTHAGPGRFVLGKSYSLVADTFFPEFYQRLVLAMADVVEAALADSSAAEVGYVIGSAPDAHVDRRCEDMESYQNDTMPVIVVKKEGIARAVLVSYAVHGTVYGIDSLTLSSDVAGAIEGQVAALFDTPVNVLFLNSWAGDMRPTDPSVDEPGSVAPDAAAGAQLPNPAWSQTTSQADRLERLGITVARAVERALTTLSTTTEPVIRAHTYRYPIDRESLGYASGEFAYPFGAAFCMSESSCTESVHQDGLDRNCLAFSRSETAPRQAAVTVGRVAGLPFVTWPGEAGTRLAERVMARVRAVAEAEHVLFLGYANGYLGYQLEEHDWWAGGYEASGGVWGPRQGDYMAQRLVEIVGHDERGDELPFEQPRREESPSDSGTSTWAQERGLDVGRIAVQPAVQYATSDSASVSVYGADPWHGAPVAVLELDRGDGDQGSAFAAVTSARGLPSDSDGQGYSVELALEPGFEVRGPVERHFQWTFSLPLSRRTYRLSEAVLGQHRFRFRIRVPTGDTGTDATSEIVEVTSDTFVVTP